MRVGFDTLEIQTYLTAGPKESRAWTVKKGATAPEAAGVIHTDFEKVRRDVFEVEPLLRRDATVERDACRRIAELADAVETLTRGV